MAKLTLVAAPTFKSKVGVPVAGGAPVEVEFTFRHRTKTELEAFVKSRADKTDVESFMDMVTGWELEDAFGAESVALLLENYIGAAIATYRAYMLELVEAREKN
jgi:Phage tail assembly chaperone